MNSMKKGRITIVILGILLPYLARIPGSILHGKYWLVQYISGGLAGFLILGGFNAICWGNILAFTFAYRRAYSIWFPVIVGFAYPIYGHYSLDIASDGQAAIALIVIPIRSVPLVILGGLIGLVFDVIIDKKLKYGWVEQSKAHHK